MSQPKIVAARVGLSMVRQIVIEVEPPDDSQTVFRLCIDENLVAEGLTAAQAHMLVGESLIELACRSQTRRLRRPRAIFRRELAARAQKRHSSRTDDLFQRLMPGQATVGTNRATAATRHLKRR
jgi:hypothetical protein